MEVSVASSATSALQQQYPVARQPERPSREREAAPETQARANQAQNNPPPRAEREAQSARQSEARRPEPPKPVVNAQGQKTGTIINTTA